MTPERAAKSLAKFGAALLALALLLRVLSAANAYALSERRPPTQTQPYAAVPYVGEYTFSPSGAQAGFKQGWVLAASPDGGRQDDFYLDLRTGLFTPGKLPAEDPQPFLLSDNRLWLESAEGFPLSSGSPQDMIVDPTSLARSPDRAMMAFIARRDQNATLFVLSVSGRLDILAQADFLAGPSWSPDGQLLVFSMRPVDAQEQGIHLYRVQRDGSDLRQLTSGDWVDTTPRWSPDGRSIAYFRVPLTTISDNIDIYLIGSDGGQPIPLVLDNGVKNNLNWIAGRRRLVYITPSKDWPRVEELRVIDVDAEKPQSTRLYPPVSVEAIACPKTLPRGGTATVRITLLNSGPQPVAIPLVLRAGEEPVPLVSPSSTSPEPSSTTSSPIPTIPAQRSQPIALTGGEQRTLDWPAAPVPGLVTYLSALVLPEGQFPVSEKHCVVRNTYLGLPNLPYLPFILPLVVVGMLLIVPWLRQQGKLWWWGLWLAFPLLIAALIALEIQFLPPL